jgi:hypothetical protein
VQVGVGGAEPEVEPATVADQAGSDVEEPESEPFAPGPPVVGGQGQGAQPQSDVVASATACQYSQLPKNGCTGAWFIPKSFFSARMVSSGSRRAAGGGPRPRRHSFGRGRCW